MMGLALQFPSVFPLTKQPKLGFRRLTLPLSEIADAPSSLLASQMPQFAPTVSSATSNGNRRGQPQRRTSSMGRTKKRLVENEKPYDERSVSKPSKSNQEEIISLFKRIQSSISKGESPSIKREKKNVGSSEDEPVTETLLDVLRRSRKKIEGETGARKGQESNFTQPEANVKLARPPSNFTKRSPIPSRSAPRGKLLVPKSREVLTEKTEKEEKAPMVEKMKLAELKELAKARGIKGYSKLKKGELVDLLRSSL